MVGDDNAAHDKTVVTVIAPLKKQQAGDDDEACLVVIYGQDLGKKYRFHQDAITIGRSSKSDIHIDEESVSRNHCRLKRIGKAITIKDLGSTNGTYVNDKLSEEVILRDGDLIKVGRTIFKFLSGGNIENAYHEEIYRLMTVDGLTQVFNKRYFLESLERELSRSRRYRRDLSLIMFDIDHFKQINDTFGHLAGDAVLKQLCQVVHGKIRREDLLCRYGGEEFVILLPEIDHFNTKLTAEKIRRLVERTTFSFEDTVIPVTISLGITTIDTDSMDPEAFIKGADEQLYRAKNSGRNRVCG
jgi:two-component system, cell cycle response regulator